MLTLAFVGVKNMILVLLTHSELHACMANTLMVGLGFFSRREGMEKLKRRRIRHYAIWSHGGDLQLRPMTFLGISGSGPANTNRENHSYPLPLPIYGDYPIPLS